VGCPMGTQHAHYEPFAWWLTREQIGLNLRERYPALQELPPRLLTLVRELGAVEGNRLPKESSPSWLRKLDTIEGNRLLRTSRKRLRTLAKCQGSLTNDV